VAAFAGQVVEGGAELGQELEEVESGLGLQGEEDLAVEAGDGQVGIGEVDDGIDVVVEGVGKGPQGGGFAGADVAGDEGGEVFLQSEGQAALGFAVAAGGVEVFAGEGLGKGGVAETVEVIESSHRSFPPWG